jgi:hypothetical protein
MFRECSVDVPLKAAGVVSQNAAKEYEECVANSEECVPEVLLHLARVQRLMAQVSPNVHHATHAFNTSNT